MHLKSLNASMEGLAAPQEKIGMRSSLSPGRDMDLKHTRGSGRLAHTALPSHPAHAPLQRTPGVTS